MMLSFPSVVTQVQALQAALLLKSQAAAEGHGVVLDASALTQFDSSALAVMLDCRRAAVAGGKTFAVHGLPPKLGQLADLYGVAELIPASV